ncbi:gamma carbonic anhydrase family protein [Shewanella phaeophyticola]|uniref:Gamma carbonic anhydrase family protein n=1 Tax=Shewanella phaeophyticola TaxID=2978345 RepID=A0ABT2P8R0_9GAMM|nr:gamma carbonic anhydrase family protein [Shewanella sp. KJ10-1]MCT8988235.1 gamma carbonic anhydrase family protein [Shewanella sp. KJ10-1]MCU7375029.1 gamma carbonic anhydrase family protein [Paucibacter sp. O1-1]MDA3830031.1 gamma carbonic anhydrase family protein [Paucibacter sp. O1-1]
MSTNIRTYQGIHPNLADNVYVDESAVLVGDIKLDHDASVWPLVAARGDVNKIRIGKRSNVQDGSILHVTRKSSANPNGHPLIIGDDVTIGHKAMLHGCHIGNRVLIGMGAILLDGAIVEDDVIVGAGSLVPPNKVLQSGFLYVGSPCKQARPLTDAERAFLPQSADNYVRLKNEYLVDLLQSS